jgi:DNA-directed RNA polymerase specialized sigma24 family protein
MRNLEKLPDLERVLQAMSPEDQAILVAHFYYGAPDSELATLFGIQKRAMNYRIAAALKRTRAKLGIGSE